MQGRSSLFATCVRGQVTVCPVAPLPIVGVNPWSDGASPGEPRVAPVSCASRGRSFDRFVVCAVAG
eukprot:5857161-Prorocentrum_lima.AAC.1